MKNIKLNCLSPDEKEGRYKFNVTVYLCESLSVVALLTNGRTDFQFVFLVIGVLLVIFYQNRPRCC